LPAVLLVLAGSLLPDPKKDDDTSVQEEEGTASFLKRVFTVYVSRFVLMPTLAFTLLRVVRNNFPAIAAMLSDKLLLFVLLIQACMPSAQNSTVILQLNGNRRAAASMARTLIAVYVLGVPAMSFWLSKILMETNLLA
jgi:predicted permease